jgi:hypothetical protein
MTLLGTDAVVAAVMDILQTRTGAPGSIR